MTFSLSRFAFVLPFIALAPGGAEAWTGARTTLEAPSAIERVAMCGRNCRDGGRHVSGPPEVCAELGLLYCGPSGPPPQRGRDRDDDWRDDRRDDRRRDTGRDFDRRDGGPDFGRPDPGPGRLPQRPQGERPAAAPAKPATPPTLSVSPTSVARGGTATVTWNGGSGAKTCALYLTDATRNNYQPWGNALTGSHPVPGITSTTSFSLTCLGAGGAYLPGPVPTAVVRVN